MARVRKGEYTKAYTDIRGVELGGSGSKIAKNRLAYAENVYRDYDGDDSGIIESVPGYRRIASLGGRIHSLVLQKSAEGEDALLIHSGKNLYRMKISEKDSYIPAAPIAELKNGYCPSFSFGSYVYYLTGEKIVAVNENGEASEVGERPTEPYAPILTLNGERYEQRNLLTNRFKTRYLLADPSKYTNGTPGLKYKILDPELCTCAVIGMNRSHVGVLHVPSYATINGKSFRVTEIAPKAFSFCVEVTEIIVAEGIEVIGEMAFTFCQRATKITLPHTLYKIGIGCFDNCHYMTDLYLGYGLAEIEASPFHLCRSLSNIHYAGAEEQFNEIVGISATEGYTVTYLDENKVTAVRLPLAEPAKAIYSVLENGNSASYTREISEGKVTAVVVTSTEGFDEPIDFVIDAEGDSVKYDFGQATNKINSIEAILGCTVAEIFDNRVFLSGNPRLPNTVFYSSIEEGDRKSPLYFGNMNYFSDGSCGYPVRALLAANDSLAVFKSGDDGSGSIFYHSPTDTGDNYVPRIYPETYVHSGIGAKGGALSFMDDPVFLTKSGLYALSKKAINYERSVVCRSHNVNFDLLREDLESAKLTEWCGYLVILAGENIYLADSRSTFTHDTGAAEYEWFVIRGVGSFEGDRLVYRFDSFFTDEIEAHERCGEVFEGEAYSMTVNGRTVYFCEIDGTKYSLYRTGERSGGIFSPASAIIGDGDLLFFGTEGGVLCLFNNDMRGIPPDDIKNMADFDAAEYSKIYSRRIHQTFYSFDGHKVRYAIKTAYDDCGIPHLTKSTVKHSLVVKCRCTSDAKIHVEVGTEGSEYGAVTSFPSAPLSFAEMNLESLSLSVADTCTLPIAEKEKGWVEKQIALYSDAYASPIGIYAIAYRYTVKGNVKKR